MDPLLLYGRQYRDLMPKRGLDGLYVGDQYPLCYDLPERAFLRKGAKYRAVGGSPKSHMLQYRSELEEKTTTLDQFVTLDEGSDLYNALCQPGAQGCQYPATVTLSSNLVCAGPECDVDTVRLVKVNGIFYGKFSPNRLRQLFSRTHLNIF